MGFFSVPILPKRGCPAVEHISERTLFLPRRQPFGEYADEYLRAEYARIEASRAVVFFDKAVQRPFVPQSDIEGIGVRRQKTAAKIARSLVVIFFDHRRSVRLPFPLKRFSFQPQFQKAVELEEPIVKFYEIAGVYKLRRQIGDAVFIDVAFLYIRPISRKPASVFLADDYCVFAAAFHIRKIMQHIGEILFHERIVAVEFIVLIRQNDYGAAPARRTSAAAEKRGRMLNVAVIYVLTIDDIPHPLFIHFTHVEYMHRGLAGNLSVARIAEPLPMGTVGGNAAVDIIQLSADIYVVKPV